jgi:hypothetical protein
MNVDPRGLRNCNPGNLRAVVGQRWLGEADSDPDGFCRFSRPYFGIRAMARTLSVYASRDGIDTLNELVERYAALNARSVVSYAAFLAERLRAGRDEILDIPCELRLLIPAMIEFENGCQPYSLALIARAILGSKPQ